MGLQRLPRHIVLIGAHSDLHLLCLSVLLELYIIIIIIHIWRNAHRKQLCWIQIWDWWFNLLSSKTGVDKKGSGLIGLSFQSVFNQVTHVHNLSLPKAITSPFSVFHVFTTKKLVLQITWEIYRKFKKITARLSKKKCHLLSSALKIHFQLPGYI